MERPEAKSRQLGDADAAGVEELEHRLVSQPLRCLHVGRLQEPVDVLPGEELRKRHPAAGVLESRGRVGGDSLLGEEEPEQAPEGRGRPGDRPGRSPVGTAKPEPPDEILPPDVSCREPLRLEVPAEGRQVAPISLEGVLRQALLDGQVVEEEGQVAEEELARRVVRQGRVHTSILRRPPPGRRRDRTARRRAVAAEGFWIESVS